MPFDVFPFRWALRSQKVVPIPKRTKQLLESCLVRPAMQNFAKHVRAVALERPRHPAQHAALSALGIYLEQVDLGDSSIGDKAVKCYYPNAGTDKIDSRPHELERQAGARWQLRIQVEETCFAVDITRSNSNTFHVLDLVQFDIPD